MPSILQLLLGGSGEPPAVDPYFYSVTSLLHGDGTNGAQNNTFLDSSTNNFTITRNGNTTQGSFSPFSQTGWSNYFDGTGDYLTIADNAALDMGSSNFTIEGWYFPVGSAAVSTALFSKRADSSGVGGILLYYGGAGLTPSLLVDIGGSWAINSASTVPFTANQWNHFAVVRNGSAFNLYINGVSGVSATNAGSIPDNSSAFTIGATGANGAFPISTCYISNFRVVKGTAVYTAAFTPPTAPLTAITNTSLLTCQANRFLDASSNAFAITRNGDVSVQPFSPFNPTTAYSTSTVGGSGYFDGSGDYLDIASSATLTPSGDFTIEFWAYPTSGSGTREWYSKGLGIQIYSSGASWVLALSANNNATYYINTSFGTLIPFAWQHVVVTRSGNSYVGFVNGVATSLATSSSAPSTGTDVLRIGDWSGSAVYPVVGYMSGIRYVNGTAVYGTSTFTPPTSPPTAITNTSFLANFTNAGIFDNAADADYETVGNAQISTSEKKYGTGSIYLDGTGDWLTTASRPLVALTGDFTVECWIYPTSVATTYQGIYSTTGTSSSDIQVQLNTNQIRLSSYTAEIVKGGSVQANTWTHIAVCRAAGVVKLFQNGTVVASAANTTSWVAGTAIIGNIFGNSYPFTGYIDDFRISNGVARYTYNFTPPTAEFPNIGGTVTLTADPYFDYTTLLLPGNGTNGAQNNTFLDSSTNAFSITRNGNTTQGTFSPFSQTGWGNYFDGTGDYLTTNATQAIPATGDFTVDGWIWCNSYANGPSIISQGTAGTSGRTVIYITTAGKLALQITSTINEFGSAIPTNQWVYFAITRTGSTVTAYINNSSIGTATNSGSIQNTTLTIGGEWNGDPYRWIGYLSNIRVSNVVRTITAAPTAPFTSDVNTVVLTCQSNRFIDNSSNAFAITRNGDVSVQAFSPFNPTAAWSASTNGGSGYFDGSGDYLTVPDNAAFDFGSGDFTISAWVYPQGAGGIIDQGGGGASSNRSFEIYMSSASSISNAYISSDGTYQAGYNLTGTTVPNAWNFIELTRASGTLRLFVNGVQQSSVSANVTIFNSTATVAIGNTSANAVNPYTGYISDVRVLKGTGSATSTVPTAPLTAITNTQLLCNFTNAGIYDATSKNDLETVGNAQISTTQSKFGGSSMYFDGSGDYVIVGNSSTNFIYGTGDFTIEMWIYWLSTSNHTLYDQRPGTTQGAYPTIDVIGGQPIWYVNSANRIVGSTISTGQWYHLAISRYNGSTRMFLNGSQVGSTYADTNDYLSPGAARPSLGSGFNYTSFFNGYIDDFRVTKGIARYTSNFTPPTTAFLTL